MTPMGEGFRARLRSNEEVVREYASRAHADLAGSGLPEFGPDTVTAIVDTAGDALTDDGIPFDRATLERVAASLA